jgi:hypothetical protein
MLLLFILIAVLCIDIHATVENIASSEITNGSAQTKAQQPSTGFIFEGGNITELNISHVLQSSLWQGVYGSVSTTLVLQDASGNVFYNWSTSNVSSGEIYFSQYSDLDFESIVDPTSSFVAFVQSNYGVANSTNRDNLTQTFQNGAHTNFQVGSISITTPSPRVLTYNSTGAMVFETIFLREGGLNRDAYATLIAPDKIGFQGWEVDFQAMLPMNSSESTTTYYLFAELQ